MEKFTCPKSLAYQKCFLTEEAAYFYASFLQKKTNMTFVVHPEDTDGVIVYVVYKLIDFNSYRF